VIYAVFEPLKLSRTLWWLQLAIRGETGGRSTHVGMMWTDEIRDLLEVLRGEGPLPIEDVRGEWESAGRVVSATWPKVKIESIWERYVGYRVWLREAPLSPTQEALVRGYWEDALKKGKRYSLGGLIWYVLGPWVGAIAGVDKDVDPRGAFCSEAATNSLYRAGFKVFSFIGDAFEDALLRARTTGRYEEWRESLTEQEEKAMARRGLAPQLVWSERYKKWLYGYKVSPWMFRVTPALRDLGYIEIRKRGVAA